ncbi:MAG: alanine-synthesizing transaminase, partial [Cyclobacteriaceae bacterium]
SRQQKLEISDPKVVSLVKGWLTDDMPLDQQFVYYLLAAKQVVVVPISSFCSDLMGFRMTLLEEDSNDRLEIYKRIREGIMEYCTS